MSRFNSVNAPLPVPNNTNSGTGAVTALRNHTQGVIDAVGPGPGITPVASVAILVLRVGVTGNFLVCMPFSYLLGTATSATWQLVRHTGSFTVNGVAATPGFTLFPTVAAGTSVVRNSTKAITAAEATIDIGALDLSGVTVGSLVGYELQLSASGGSGTVLFTGAAAGTPLGNLSAIEVL
jgi:hypothetical protein